MAFAFETFDFGAALKSAQPAEPPAPGLLRSAADTGLSLARGAVQGVKMLSDVTGAGNAASETLQRGIDWLSQNFSDYSQWEQLTSAQDQRAAALSGSTWEEIKAAARSFGKRPIDFLAEAAGTSIPTMAAAFLPGGQGAVLGRVAMLGMGAAQGAGSVKGQIFEEVEKAWKQAGATPDEARERAAAAQDYFGSNSGQIALGTALGAVAGSTGVEAGLLGKAAPGAAAKASIFERAGVPRFVREGVKEAIPEAAQGGQETLAQNLALQNEGFDVGTMQGVVGNAVLEGLAGGAFGAAASPLHRQHRAELGMQALATGTTVDEVIAGANAVAEGTMGPGGISADQEGRAMSAMERQAKDDESVLKFATQAGATPDLSAGTAPRGGTAATATEVETPPFSDRVLELRQQLADPAVRDALRAMDERAFSTVAQYASVVDRPDINMPEATRERLLGLAEGIVSRALLKPVRRGQVGAQPAAAGQIGAASAPQPARIGLDTSPTGTIRVDSRGTAAPETRADAINTRQATAPRQRPDGMEQQVSGPGRPRGFVLQGEGTLTPTATEREPAPQLLLTADGYPYGTRAGAAARATREGGTVVEVPGGFAVQKETTSAQPDMAGAAPGVAAGGVEPRGDAAPGERTAGPAAGDAVRGPDPRAQPAGDGGRGAVQRGPDGQPAAALSVGDTFGLDGKTWTVTESGDTMVRASDGAGSTKIVAKGSKLWKTITGASVSSVSSVPGGGPAGSVRTTPAVQQRLFAEWGGKRMEVESLEDARDKWERFRDTSEAGVSQIGNGIRVLDQDGKFVGRISYNGRIWSEEDRGPEGEKPEPAPKPSLRDRVDAMRKPKEAAPAPDPDAFPADRLAKLSDLTGRDRAEVAEQFTGFVRDHGREKAGRMLDTAIQQAEKADAARKAKAQEEASAAAERAAAEKAQAEEREQQRQVEEKARAQREEDDLRREEEAQAAARAEKERAEKDKADAERKQAEADKAKARRAEIVALRKREAVLKKLLECLN